MPLAFALNLTACGRQPALPPTQVQSPPEADLPVKQPDPAVRADPAPIASAAPMPVDEAIPYEPRQPSTAHDPAQALQDWAKAVEARDWSAARAFWGDRGERSGLSVKAFAAKWQKLRHPEVTIGKGEGEGGAGSLYYTAPVQISDGARVMSGEVVIRRVNDVDGASAEQLRWHIESTTLTP
jgi:hypothetical protein